LKAQEEAKKEAELEAKEEKAKRIAREKARAKQHEIRAQYKLARTYYKNKKYQEAIEEFEKVLALNPEHRRAHWYIARSQRKIVRAEERARIEAEKREEAEEHFRAGKSKYLLGDLEGAIDELRTTLKLDPVHQRAGQLLTIILQEEKK